MPRTSITSNGYKEIRVETKIILKSYDTFVAILDVINDKLFITDEYYSQSTTRHINLFKRRFSGKTELKVSQLEIDVLAN